ncbi:MAG: carbohydrate porin [Candidatus Omnitrophota bacterium]
MLPFKVPIAVFGGMFGVSLLFQASFAADSVSNEEMLSEIRGLNKIVQQQQEKINQLEQRISKQEAAPQLPGVVVSESEIDKRIDERISQKAPAYQLMEGLSLSIGATSIVQGAHHANGDNQLSRKEDVTDGTISTDIALDKKFGDYGESFVCVTAGQGAGVEDNLNVFSNVNFDADNDQNVRLAEAWYEFYFKKISGALAFGKLDPTKYIDTNNYANSETTQFLGRMFRNSPVVEFPANAGGIHFGAAPYDFFDVNFVAVDADADWENVFDSMFVAGQLNLKPKLFGKEGNYRLFAWSNGANHTKWTDTAKDKENGYGFGLSFDQAIIDNVGVFVRYGWQDPKVYLNGNTFSLAQSWSIGPQVNGSLWGRPDDFIGLGFGQVMPSGKYKKVNGLRAKTENHLEWYYNFKVNGHLTLSPDLQVIWHPYGKDAVNGDEAIVVGGIRGQVDF